MAARRHHGHKKQSGHNARNKPHPAPRHGTAAETITVRDVFPPEVIAFAEAVTHPFGNGAIGAVLPDQFQELVVPCVDRHEIDLSASGFNYSGDWTNDHTMRLLGVLLWIQPRCLAAGTVAWDDVIEPTDVTSNAQEAEYPYFVQANGNVQDAQASVEMYTLCYTGYWSTGNTTDGDRVGFYQGADGNSTLFPGYRMLPYPRAEIINDNCAKGRLLGAGLKVWSEEAPIETGGYAVAGWMTMRDVLEATKSAQAMATVQQRIKGAVRRPGVKGVTARYSCLQDPQQCEAQPIFIPDDLYTPEVKGNPTTGVKFSFPIPHHNVDLSVYDVCSAGSFVPSVFWRFNTSNDSASANTDGVYTLKIMSMIHVEGQPNGDSPFMSQHVQKYMGIEHIKSVLEDWETYPPAAGGHSFKSFMTKVSSVVAKVAKGAGHVIRVLTLVDKMLKVVPK